VPAGFLTPHRLAIGVLCLISLIGSVGLAWWQWDRFESASGTFQNLGYVLQWPLFGLFPAFMVWRIRRLRREAAGADQPKPELEPERRQEWGRRPVPEVPAPRATRAARIVRDEEDDELAAYNRYLAELNARDQQDR
jgi:hypothetical protein